jgi:BirA family transcriptional regulator, biotin operon repressor / biotin---[acetyl-CoA-carboxylase] ligase
MPKGNFAATLVMRPSGGPQDAALRSFIASLALFDACVAVTGRSEGLALKWPNDVLLNGGKLAGILLETSTSHGHLSIGFGVNLAAAPDASEVEAGALRPVSLAHETGVLVSPQEFLDALAPAFAQWEQRFQTQGFAPVQQAWLNRATRLGQQITAKTGTETLSGIFETVDENGHLILSTPLGRRSIPAADVFF